MPGMSVSQGATNSEAGSKGLASSSNKPAKVGWNDVRVRAFSLNEVEPMLNFIYRSPRDTALMQSIDFEAWPKENEYRQFLNEVALNPTKQPMLAVEHKGRTIGVHILNNLQGNQADFQAYFWSAQDCGKGIVTVSWFKASQYFFEHFNYDTFYFRSPKENPMAAAAVKKLPLNFVGEEEIFLRNFKPGQRARIYSLSRSEFEAMLSNDEDESDL